MPAPIKKLASTVAMGSVAVFTDGDEPFIALNSTVSGAAAVAFTAQAPIDLEVFEGTHLIRRIAPFQVGRVTTPGHISRIATQVNPETGINHLEVFVISENNSEKAFNVVDANVQLVCLSAALAQAKLTFAESGGFITEASVTRQPPDARS